MGVSEAFFRASAGFSSIRNSKANARNVDSLIAAREAQLKMAQDEAANLAETRAMVIPALERIASSFGSGSQESTDAINQVAAQASALQDKNAEVVAQEVVRELGGLFPSAMDEMTLSEQGQLQAAIRDGMEAGRPVAEIKSQTFAALRQVANERFGPPEDLNIESVTPNTPGFLKGFQEALGDAPFSGPFPPKIEDLANTGLSLLRGNAIPDLNEFQAGAFRAAAQAGLQQANALRIERLAGQGIRSEGAFLARETHRPPFGTEFTPIQ